jgi:hypothetical protein
MGQLDGITAKNKSTNVSTKRNLLTGCVTEQSCHLHQFVHIIAEFPVEEVAEPQ